MYMSLTCNKQPSRYGLLVGDTPNPVNRPNQWHSSSTCPSFPLDNKFSYWVFLRQVKSTLRRSLTVREKETTMKHIFSGTIITRAGIKVSGLLALGIVVIAFLATPLISFPHDASSPRGVGNNVSINRFFNFCNNGGGNNNNCGFSNFFGSGCNNNNNCGLSNLLGNLCGSGDGNNGDCGLSALCGNGNSGDGNSICNTLPCIQNLIAKIQQDVSNCIQNLIANIQQEISNLLSNLQCCCGGNCNC